MAPLNIAVSLLIVLAHATSSVDCSDISAQITTVDRSFKAGELEAAVSQAEHILSCPNATIEERVSVHLTLAGIHDRHGLHNNSRPVSAALRSIDAASDLVDPADSRSHAAINLAKARYYYRSESSDSDYPTARRFARLSLDLFEELEDFHGQADIVHLTGLFHLQRQELEDAQIYFERSLVLENLSGAPRPIMLADYERHMGFVYQLSGDLKQAINAFERSFIIRRENGLTDQAMFAAIALGRALVSDSRAEEAKSPLDFALKTAEALGSPEGRAQASLASGQMHEQLGDRKAAIKAYEATLAAAQEIDRTSILEASRAALDRLRETE